MKKQSRLLSALSYVSILAGMGFMGAVVYKAGSESGKTEAFALGMVKGHEQGFREGVREAVPTAVVVSPYKRTDCSGNLVGKGVRANVLVEKNTDWEYELKRDLSLSTEDVDVFLRPTVKREGLSPRAREYLKHYGANVGSDGLELAVE